MAPKAACSITAHPFRDLAYGLAITPGVDRAKADHPAALAYSDRWTTDQVSTTGIGRLRTERVSRVTSLVSHAALRRYPPAAIRSRGIWFGIHAVVRRGKTYIEAHMYGNGNTRRRAVIRGEQCRFRHQLH